MGLRSRCPTSGVSWRLRRSCHGRGHDATAYGRHHGTGAALLCFPAGRRPRSKGVHASTPGPRGGGRTLGWPKRQGPRRAPGKRGCCRPGPCRTAAASAVAAGAAAATGAGRRRPDARRTVPVPAAVAVQARDKEATHLRVTVLSVIDPPGGPALRMRSRALTCRV